MATAHSNYALALASTGKSSEAADHVKMAKQTWETCLGPSVATDKVAKLERQIARVSPPLPETVNSGAAGGVSA